MCLASTLTMGVNPVSYGTRSCQFRHPLALPVFPGCHPRAFRFWL